MGWGEKCVWLVFGSDTTDQSCIESLIYGKILGVFVDLVFDCIYVVDLIKYGFCSDSKNQSNDIFYNGKRLKIWDFVWVGIINKGVI